MSKSACTLSSSPVRISPGGMKELSLATGRALWQCRVCGAKDSPVDRRPRASGVCACARRQGIASQVPASEVSWLVDSQRHDGDDAQHYQERQVRNAIREASK